MREDSEKDESKEDVVAASWSGMEVLDSLTAIWLDSSRSDERWLDAESSWMDREVCEEETAAAAGAPSACGRGCFFVSPLKNAVSSLCVDRLSRMLSCVFLIISEHLLSLDRLANMMTSQMNRATKATQDMNGSMQMTFRMIMPAARPAVYCEGQLNA